MTREKLYKARFIGLDVEESGITEAYATFDRIVIQGCEVRFFLHGEEMLSLPIPSRRPNEPLEIKGIEGRMKMVISDV